MIFSSNKLKTCKHLLAAAVLITGSAAATDSYARHDRNDRNCVNYRLHSTGEAGIRTINAGSDNFTRSRHGRASGQLCGGDRVKVELSKRDIRTQVGLEVDGRRYVFGRGDHGDRQVNSWYRRYITVDMPRGQRYGHRDDRYDRHDRDRRYGQHSRHGQYGQNSRYNRYDRHDRGR